MEDEVTQCYRYLSLPPCPLSFFKLSTHCAKTFELVPTLTQKFRQSFIQSYVAIPTVVSACML